MYKTMYHIQKLLALQSIDLQVGRRGPVSPLVDLFCDHCPAEWTALLPVEPQSNAFVTEYMLQKGSQKINKKQLDMNMKTCSVFQYMNRGK